MQAIAAATVAAAIGDKSFGNPCKYLLKNFKSAMSLAEVDAIPPASEITKILDASIRQAKPKKSSNPTRDGVKTFIANSAIDPRSDAFLSSFEWRATRMMALKEFGNTCQCCGASPKTGAVIHVDHIKPRKLFPELALSVSNLQILCGDCNHGKGNWDQTDWRK